jgi:pimeloyl-ACP methyl ester carboxylesterase
MTQWLLLRGLWREQGHWGSFTEQLARETGSARIVPLDLPGCGAEAGRRAPWSMRGMTEALRSRWLGLRQDDEDPWVLLAISLGGMVAMDWCARFPEDFRGVVLVNTSARGLGSGLERFNPRFVPRLLGALGSRGPTQREDLILKMTSRLQGREREAALARNLRLARERPIPLRVGLRQLTAAASFDCPAHWGARTLVVRSLGDGLVSPECSARLARRIRAPLIDHPWAGHDLPLDDPHWLARTVADWERAPQG